MGQEGEKQSGSGRGVLIPYSCSILLRVTCLIALAHASCTQFWQILLPRHSQILDLTLFFSKVPDLEGLGQW